MKDVFDSSADAIARIAPSAEAVTHESVQRLVRAERRRSKASPVARFEETLANTFDTDTVTAILGAVEKLQLPLPDDNVEFLRAYEGALFFSNDYGMVVRIEALDENIKLGRTDPMPIQRVNDNPWILQPIGSVTAGNAIIEICPGVHTTDNGRDLDNIEAALRRTGAKLYDAGCSNLGRLPIATPEFPDGIPVVIDRLAVKRLTGSTRNIARAIENMGVDIAPQKTLYADLKKKFRHAWPKGADAPHPERMLEFWAAMRQARAAGILVAGWNEKIKDEYKIIDARISAAAYDGRLRKHFKAVAKKVKVAKPTTGAGLRTSSAPKPGKI